MPETRIKPDIAIIGAGIAGCSCASTLANRGFNVVVLEKSGDIGGRLATRRRPDGHWDHGAPALAAQDPAFMRLLESLHAEGTVERVGAPGNQTRYHGRPDMRELLRPVAAEIPMIFRSRALRLRRGHAGWVVETESGNQGPFRAVVMAIPAPQAANLLAGSNLDAMWPSSLVSMAPLWTLMLGFESHRELPTNPDRRIIEQVIRQPRTPWAPPGWYPERWVVHATARWSRVHMDLDATAAGERILRALDPSLVGSSTRPGMLMPHRWRYAHTTSPLGRTHLWDAQSALGLAGDWCLGATAEDAFASGTALAGEMSRSLLTTSSQANADA